MPRRELRNAGNFERRPGRRQGERKPKKIVQESDRDEEISIVYFLFCRRKRIYSNAGIAAHHTRRRRAGRKRADFVSEDSHHLRLWPTGVPKWRWQYHGLYRRAAEVGQHQRSGANNRSRARADAL